MNQETKNCSMIREKIWQAMETTFNDMVDFTDEPGMKAITEYLFTVNIAKAIRELNGPAGDPFKIYLEKSTAHVARDCIRSFRRIPGAGANGRQWTVRKRIPKIDRKGRVDVAVYTDGFQPAECVVEVKGIDPPRIEVIKDLKRNAELLRLCGDTGPSELSFTVLATLHARDWNSAKLESHKEEVAAKYKRWLAEIARHEELRATVEVRTVSISPGRVIEGEHYDDFDAAAAHNFFGAQVFFYNARPSVDR